MTDDRLHFIAIKGRHYKTNSASLLAVAHCGCYRL